MLGFAARDPTYKLVPRATAKPNSTGNDEEADLVIVRQCIVNFEPIIKQASPLVSQYYRENPKNTILPTELVHHYFIF